MFQQSYSAFLISVAMLTVFSLSAQTIVSTSPTNKNVVLEEFGGMYCIYCPHGHQILADLEEALQDNITIINYQVGPYAYPLGDDPDLGNDYSFELENQAFITGYPGATVNRHNFPGLEQSGLAGTTALGRADWAEAVGETIQLPAPVNIAAEASLNITTRQLEIYIEYYYTSEAVNSNNRLHVGVLQNNVLAPQHGGEAGDFYAHQHLFREYLTGQNGHIISNTQTGAFGSLTYNIVLPDFYRDVWTDPVNIELAIFISEDEEEILQGINVQPELFSESATDANLVSILAASDICDDEFAAQVTLRNDGFNNLESCIIRYGISGGASNEINWAGNLESLATEVVNLPSLPVFTGFYNNEYYVELLSPNDTSDPTDYNNARTHFFTAAPSINSQQIELAIRTDQYGYELYWEVVDTEGVVFASGGNQVVGQTNGGAQIATDSDPGAYDDETFIIEDIFLPIDGCYQLRVLDDFADGLCCNYGIGFYRLRELGEAPFLEGGEFGSLEEKFFSVGMQPTVAVQDVHAVPAPQLFPNPVGPNQVIQLRWAGPVPSTYNWQIITTNGQVLKKGNQQELPKTSEIPAGYYFFKLSFAEQQHTIPLLIQR